jgi:REP element-mobilizing transposase RayT
MLSSFDQLTTVVSSARIPFLQKIEPAASDLYFHLVLRIKGEILDAEQEFQLKKYIICFVRRTGGRIQAADFAQERVHLLVGLSQFCAPGIFIRELKLVTSTFARRKLGAKKFGWQEKFDAFTVSLTQIERVGNYISRQKWLDAPESYASSWNRIASRELF